MVSYGADTRVRRRKQESIGASAEEGKASLSANTKRISDKTYSEEKV